MAARLSDSVVWTGKPGKNHPSSIQAKAKHLCNGVLTRDGTTLSHLGEAVRQYVSLVVVAIVNA